MAPLPKATAFALVYSYKGKTNKFVTKLTNLGGKLDRAKKEVRFDFDSAGARKSFRKKNKEILNNLGESTILREIVKGISFAQHNKLKKSGARQLKDPKTEVLVVDKKGKVIVIDKKDLKGYERKGWSLAESDELDEYIKKDGARRRCAGGDGRRTEEVKKEKVAEMDEGKYDSDKRIPKMSDKGKELLAWMANSFEETGGPYLDKKNVHNLTTYAIDRIIKKLDKLKNLPPDKKKDVALVKKELGESVEVDEAESVPLVRTGQGSYKKDTHPSPTERLYQAKDKGEYMRLMNAADNAMAKGMTDKFGITGDYKKYTVNIKFKNEKARKYFEKDFGIKESVEHLDERDLPQVVFDFKSERDAKQFAKDVENSAVGLANDGVERYKGKYRVVITGEMKQKDMHKKAIVKYAKKNKGEFSHASSDVTPVGYGPHGESVQSFSKDEKKLLDFINKNW